MYKRQRPGLDTPRRTYPRPAVETNLPGNRGRPLRCRQTDVYKRQYLNISDYRSDTLPDNLMDLNTIFDRVLLDPYKEKKDVENSRKLWRCV